MQKLVWQNAKGDEINLTQNPFGITQWEGFSNTGLNIQSQQVPFADGSVFLDALMEQRELSVTLAINDENDLYTRYELKRQLISALNPKMGEGYLIYTNDFISKRIKCVAQLPIFPTKNSNDAGSQKASLSWVACEPYWENLEETAIELKNGFTEVNNEGDVKIEPKFTIWGNAEEITIKSGKTNQELKFSKPIGNDIQGIEINTGYGKKEVYSIDYELKESFIQNRIENVVYDDKFDYYLCDFEGKLLRTRDFIYYEKTLLSSTVDFICTHNGNTVCVNTRGQSVFLSTDSLNFTEVQSLDYHPTGVIYSDKFSKFIITLENGDLLISTDGQAWETVSTEIGESIQITKDLVNDNVFLYNGTKFFILDSLSPFNVSYSTSWASIGLNDSVKKLTIANNNGVIQCQNDDYALFLSTGYSIYASCELIPEIKLTNYAYDLNNNCFIGVKNKTIYKAYNPISWVPVKELSLLSNNYATINYPNKIVVSSDDALYLGNTPENISLVSRKFEIEFVYWSKFYKKYFVISSESTRKIYTSNDLKTFELVYDTYSVYCLEESDKGLILGFASSKLIYSTDGITFNSVDMSKDFGGTGASLSFSPKLRKFMSVQHASEEYRYERIFISENLEMDILEFTMASDYYPAEIKWCAGWDEFIIVGANCYTKDGINFTFFDGDTVSWEEFVIYSEEKNMAIFSGHDGGINISYDGKTKTRVTEPFSDYDIDCGSYDPLLKIFVVTGANGVHWTSNGLEWFTKDWISNKDILFIFTDDEGIKLVNSNSDESVLKYKRLDSMIDCIEGNMNFIVESGQNELFVKITPQTLAGEITYRQKYIGV